jgi:hypothetical protein
MIYDPSNVTHRKILDKNLETGNVVITKQDMVDYYSDKLKKLVILKEDGSQLESYFGFGLQRLIESAKMHKDGKYLLSKRHFAPKETTVEE